MTSRERAETKAAKLYPFPAPHLTVVVPPTLQREQRAAFITGWEARQQITATKRADLELVLHDIAEHSHDAGTQYWAEAAERVLTVLELDSSETPA